MDLTAEHIDQSLAIIRGQPDAQCAWNEIISFCQASAPSKLWASLPGPNIAKDVQEANSWLSSQLPLFSNATGIYLGLDTLNMRDGDGMNVGIGGTSKCDVMAEEIDWVYDGLSYGKDHMIYGLYRLQQLYSEPKWQEDFSFADYMLFLAYSGIVLGQALAQLQTNRSFLAVWGFHDGDLFRLGCKSIERFELIYE